MDHFVKRTEGEVISLEAALDTLAQVREQLKTNKVTQSIALEADRLTGTGHVLSTYYSGKDHAIALEGLFETIWDHIKAFFRKIGEYLKRFWMWITGQKEQTTEAKVEEIDKKVKEFHDGLDEMIKSWNNVSYEVKMTDRNGKTTTSSSSEPGKVHTEPPKAAEAPAAAEPKAGDPGAADRFLKRKKMMSDAKSTAEDVSHTEHHPDGSKTEHETLGDATKRFQASVDAELKEARAANDILDKGLDGLTDKDKPAAAEPKNGLATHTTAEDKSAKSHESAGPESETPDGGVEGGIKRAEGSGIDLLRKRNQRNSTKEAEDVSYDDKTGHHDAEDLSDADFAARKRMSSEERSRRGNKRIDDLQATPMADRLATWKDYGETHQRLLDALKSDLGVAKRHGNTVKMRDIEEDIRQTEKTIKKHRDQIQSLYDRGNTSERKLKPAFESLALEDANGVPHPSAILNRVAEEQKSHFMHSLSHTEKLVLFSPEYVNELQKLAQEFARLKPVEALLHKYKTLEGLLDVALNEAARVDAVRGAVSYKDAVSEFKRKLEGTLEFAMDREDGKKDDADQLSADIDRFHAARDGKGDFEIVEPQTGDQLFHIATTTDHSFRTLKEAQRMVDGAMGDIKQLEQLFESLASRIDRVSSDTQAGNSEARSMVAQYMQGEVRLISARIRMVVKGLGVFPLYHQDAHRAISRYQRTVITIVENALRQMHGEYEFREEQIKSALDKLRNTYVQFQKLA